MAQFKNLLWSLLCLVLPVVLCTFNATSKPDEAKNKLLYGIITEHCWDTLVIRKIFDMQCFKTVFAKMLGYGIITSSTIVKVPQIINIIKAGDTKGLSELVLYMEVLGYMISMFYPYHYGQPFSSYGECVFITFQAAIILCLLWFYNRKKYPLYLVFLISSGYLAYGFVLYQGTYVSEQVWSLLFAILPQISKI